MRNVLMVAVFTIFSFTTAVLAQEKDPQAQFGLALKYEQGEGVPRDFTRALELYTASAQAGYAPAQATLGYLYLYGEGVPQDLSVALLWNQKAAEQGEPNAQLNLGVMYDDGVGVPQNKEEANRWYQKAADQGQSRAQLNLGVNYWRGQGVAQDYLKAYEILNHVRMTAPEETARWKARAALDELKKIMSKEQLKKVRASGTSRAGY